MKRGCTAPAALLQAQRDILAEFSTSRPGLNVWCIENQRPQPVCVSDHGFFHQGNVYVVINVEDNGTVFLHTWQGRLSQKVDRDVAAFCAEELDRNSEGAALMSFEFEGKESSSFLGHFQDGVIICEGKTKQFLGRASKYQKRLYVIRGRKVAVASCTEPSSSAVAPDVTLLLDGYPRIYVWIGDRVDYVSRVKAINLAKKIRTWQRDGKGHIVVIDKDEKSLSESFLKKLQICGSSESQQEDQTSPEEDQVRAVQLFRVNGDRVMYDMPLAAKQPLKQKLLTSTDCFLLDSGPSLPLYIWVGARAEPDDRRRALFRARIFAQHHGYPGTTHLCRVAEGEEPMDFRKMFAEWRDRTAGERQLVRSYSVANIGRVLFSKSDRRTVAKLSELWSDDHFLTGNGNTEMWQVNGGVVPVSQNPEGLFYNNSCYLLKHTETVGNQNVTVLYTWMGQKSNPEDQEKVQQLAADMDAALDHETAIVRVLDGKEPKHFLNTLRRSMIVFDLSLLSGRSSSGGSGSCTDPDVWMYCVREVAAETMRVTQVPPTSTSLNSSAAFIVITDNSSYVWYGKNASALEREYSKSMLAYLCPTKSHDYDIIVEGKEPTSMWVVIRYDGVYPKEFPKPNLERRSPRLVLCRPLKGSLVFEDVPYFCQEDLCETDIFILDTHDQIHLWCGSAVADRDHSLYSPVIQAYIDRDPSLRQSEDLKVWVVNQGHEPSTFYKFFRSWEEHGYGGEISYSAARKRVRQENAMIDPDCQMLDLSHLHTTKVSYKDLVKEENLPNDTHINHKEFHLSDKEFTRVLRMPRAQFYRLPFWKQRQILKSAHLADPQTDGPSTPRSLVTSQHS